LDIGYARSRRAIVAEWLRRTPAKCMGSPAQVRILPIATFWRVAVKMVAPLLPC
jgi:hypothetical protein